MWVPVSAPQSDLGDPPWSGVRVSGEFGVTGRKTVDLVEVNASGLEGVEGRGGRPSVDDPLMTVKLS